MKNILVTGGAGYIGSHTCKALAYAYKDDVHGCTSVPVGNTLGVRIDMESKSDRWR